MAPFFSFHPSRIRLSGDLFHDDAPDRRFSPAFRKIAMASGVLWRQSHAQQPQRLTLSASSVSSSTLPNMTAEA